MSTEDSQSFTYEEVKKLLCPGCHHGLPEVLTDMGFFHYCGEAKLPCFASSFREAVYKRNTDQQLKADLKAHNKNELLD